LKDEKGKSILKNNQYDFADGEREIALKKVNELLELEIEIGIDKLKMNILDLQDMISANEITSMEPFVDFIDEEKDKK
jgi:hypothetical protein